MASPTPLPPTRARFRKNKLRRASCFAHFYVAVTGHDDVKLLAPWEAAMERYVYNANMAHYRHLIAESERDPKRDDGRHKMLLTLLAEEIAKGKKLAVDQSAFASQAHHERCLISSSKEFAARTETLRR
jgi:hypothetical protein